MRDEAKKRKKGLSLHLWQHCRPSVCSFSLTKAAFCNKQGMLWDKKMKMCIKSWQIFDVLTMFWLWWIYVEKIHIFPRKFVCQHLMTFHPHYWYSDDFVEKVYLVLGWQNTSNSSKQQVKRGRLEAAALSSKEKLEGNEEKIAVYKTARLLQTYFFPPCVSIA